MLTARGRDAKDYTCLSTDDKPTKAANGSLCLEIDTGDVYAFNADAESDPWVKITD